MKSLVDIKEIFIGGIIGVANIIPGVSGGTMALILGIYERLISAIHNISLKTIKNMLKIFTFKKEGFDLFLQEFRAIDGFFLGRILIGALVMIIALAKLITYLLKNWHEPTYGFFFGLVLVSVIVPYKLIKKKTLPVIISIIIAIATVVGMSQAISNKTLIHKAKIKHELKMKKKSGIIDTKQKKVTLSKIKHYILFFIMGAVAISAMILPGVSGSFLMLLMGGYFDILKAISNRDLPLLGIFALGCLVGIVVFTRLLNFLLNRFHDQTMGYLLGLVIGSLWVIWPFKTFQKIGDETVYLSNTIPGSFGLQQIITIFAILCGIAIVAFMVWYEGKQNKSEAKSKDN